MPAKTYDDLMTRDNVDRLDYAIKLGKFGKPAVEYLIKAMKHEDLWIRYLMIDALGNSGDTRAVEPIISALKDESQDVRFMAAEALGNLGDKRAVPALEQTCKSDNCYVRIAAEESLDKLTK
jgi:HEAT repeat protein